MMKVRPPLYSWNSSGQLRESRSQQAVWECSSFISFSWPLPLLYCQVQHPCRIRRLGLEYVKIQILSTRVAAKEGYVAGEGACLCIKLPFPKENPALQAALFVQQGLCVWEPGPAKYAQNRWVLEVVAEILSGSVSGDSPAKIMSASLQSLVRIHGPLGLSILALMVFFVLILILFPRQLGWVRGLQSWTAAFVKSSSYMPTDRILGMWCN